MARACGRVKVCVSAERFAACRERGVKALSRWRGRE